MPVAGEPLAHLRGVGVPAQTVQPGDARAHVELGAVDADATRRSLRQRFGERPRQHVAGEDHVPAVVAERMLEMVEHRPGIAETAARKHDSRTLATGDLQRMLAGPEAVQGVEVERRVARVDHRPRRRREQRGVLDAKLRGPDGHRAVEVDRQVIEDSLPREPGKVVDQHLGAADAERREHRRAAAVTAVLYHLAEGSVDVRGRRPVCARAGRRFHHDDVGGGGVAPGGEVRLAGRADVAREDDAHPRGAVDDLELDGSAADDVPGVMQAHAHPGGDVAPRTVPDAHDSAGNALGVPLRVQHRRVLEPLLRGDDRRIRGRVDDHGIRARALSVLVEADLLQVRRAPEHHGKQGGGGLGAEDQPFVAQARQHSEPAAVVDVGMGADHRAEAAEIDRRCHGIAQLLRRRALEKAEIHEHARMLRLEERAAAGDLAGGAQERQCR